MNKVIKRVTALALSGVLVASAFAGCSNTQTSDDTTQKTYKVGVCQLVQHDALDAATEGFQAALKEKLGDSVEIVVQNAAGDPPTCSTIVNGFVSDNYDLIMANATAPLTAAAQATSTIPIVATSITDYASALSITDWTGKTGINVTGTSDLAPLEDQAKMIKELCPDAKTVGILYCTGETNSVYQRDVIAEELEELGYETKDFTVSESSEIAAVTQTACDSVDVIYIPTDNTMANAVQTIEPIVTAANIPVIAGEEGICKGCGIATLSISYYSIGYKAGEMAAEILADGKDPGDMEIEYAEELTKEYVAERATALGITVPDDYTAIEAE